MDAEALIALTMKRRASLGLAVRVTGWENYNGTDYHANHTRSRKIPFHRYYATASERDAAIERMRAKGLTVEIVTA